MNVKKKVKKTYNIELDEDEMKHLVGLVTLGKKQLDNTESLCNTLEISILKHDNRSVFTKHPINANVINLRLDRFKSTDIKQKLIDNL